MADPTTYFNWDVPNVGADAGAWGGVLNTVFDEIDADLNTASVAAQAALPKAGGTMTGRVKQHTESYTAVNLGATLSGVVAIDLSLGNFFYGTVTGNITFNITNPPASGDACFFVIELTGANVCTISWPASVKTAAADTTSIGFFMKCFALYTRDAGTRYRLTMPYTGMSL